jgi:lactoylglutathione lyase
VGSIDKIGEVFKDNNIPVDPGPFQPSPYIRFLYVLYPDGIRIQLLEDLK